jgi:hypothetical protein
MKDDLKNEAEMGLQRSSEGIVLSPSVPRVYKSKALDSGLGDERSEGMELPPASGNNGAGSGCDAGSPRKNSADSRQGKTRGIS